MEVDSIQTALMFLEKALLASLVFLEVCILVVYTRKILAFSKVQGDAEKWIGIFTKHLRKEISPEVVLAPGEAGTIVGRVVMAGMDNQGLAPEALERIFDVQESSERRELGRGLVFMASVGSNAPFLGLTGTVIGILIAFSRFSATGGSGSLEVMSAISQALVATVAGLLVAIPAVIFYNVLSSRSRAILDKAREVRGVIMARALHIALVREEV